MNPSSTFEKLWRNSAPYSRACAYLASLLVAATFFYHLAHGSTAYLGLLEDDFYYYLGVADKLVTTGTLTYDGTTLTNGFHPLWLAVLTGLRLLSGGSGAPFFVGLTLIALASMIATYELGRRFAVSLGASAQLGAAIAAVYSVGSARLAACGMECVVAVPLMLWLLTEIARTTVLTPKRAAFLGFVASLAILARLDIAIAVAIAIGGYVLLARPPLSQLWRVFLAFCAGGALVAVYALANLVFFGTPLPVSALAKRLVTVSGFDLGYAWNAAFASYFGPTAGVVLALGTASLLLLLVRRAKQPSAAPQLFTAAVILLFTFAFYFLNALSGWIYFGWYAYPMAPATIAALVMICKAASQLRVPDNVIAGAFAVLAILAPLNGVIYYTQHGPKWSVDDNALLAMSYDLDKHVRNDTGLFAMGAVAGIAAYVINKPVLQLEGIISDRKLVQHVKQQDRLDQVLHEYGVNYLIVSMAGRPMPMVDGCYLVTQPELTWAGRRTAKMSGEICSQPVEHFITQGRHNSWSEFGQLETFVWDLSQTTWRH
ncbi:MAG: hypothetical protein WDO56_21520 [Gammaproteobacteria bacterium]